jgi:LCP family protein required for cell wall assembly
LRYGDGRSDPDDLNGDWHEPATGRPGSRSERSGRPGPGRPSVRSGDRTGPRSGAASPTRSSRRPRPAARGPVGQHWRRFRDKRPLAQAGYALATLGAVLTVVIGVGAFAIYQQLSGNIHVIKVGDLSHRALYGAQNILVLGSQERKGQHGHFGKEVNPWTTNSDNLLLIHLDPAHTHATVLSIPRDTMVYEPACQARIRQIGTGLQGPYQSTIIDGALNIGGPTCAVTTVEDLTGITLDHFVEFDFNSFRTMVDAIGGVNVCVPKGGYHDPASGVNLPPGVRKVTYNQALAYVRTRHVLGGADAGGDLPRIQLQQAFISSVVQKVNSTGMLTNSLTLYRIAQTATKALTVDQGMSSINSLLKFAKSLTGLKAKDVSLITMPTIADPTNQNRLLPEEPQDDVLFQMVLDGQDWRGHLPLARPSQIQVRVLNAAGVTGLAKRTARALAKIGFDVISKGDAAPASATTVTYSGTAQADAAYTLMVYLHAFPAAQNLLAEPAPQTGTAGPITLILGADYANFTVNTPAPHAAKSKTGGTGTGGTSQPATAAATASSSTGPGAVQARNAGANICSGLPLGNN